MLATRERNRAWLARQRAARNPAATRANQNLGLERDALHIVGAGIKRRP